MQRLFPGMIYSQSSTDLVTLGKFRPTLVQDKTSLGQLRYSVYSQARTTAPGERRPEFFNRNHRCLLTI
ncbi:hypothetical protein GOODEAATRI_034209 [Goodea atripinnis]|uniref:Uncharacterized protein n=1 Tax=Goodea atripinnis TaxID=208336 RepID=A0ABV0PTW4_9TELE